MNRNFTARARFGAALLAALGLGSGLSACDGDSNAWSDLPTGGNSNTQDGAAPQVAITAPDSTWRVAVGDSVLVTVDASDDLAVGAIRLEGFALRGSAALGTQTRVDRFETKVVDLSALETAVRDTTVSRFLVATADSLAEDTVYISATVEDLAGRQYADTVAISVGGPRVQVLSPAAGAAVRAGTTLEVRLSASDNAGRIETIRLQLQGGATLDTVLTIDPPEASVDTVVVLAVPASAAGAATLLATAVTTSADTASGIPVQLDVVPVGGDDIAPVVSFELDLPARLEVDDTVAVSVSATDGTLVDRVGLTIRPIVATAGGTDTLELHAEELQGEEGEFRFALAELGAWEPTSTAYTLRLEVAGFAVDTAGNCATANSPGRPMSGACDPARPSAGTIVTSTSAPVRNDVLVVRGATTQLGTGDDLLVDLVADASGRRVFVSNHSQNRVEVLPFGGTRFGSAVSVGSEPWGLALGRGGDTMFVANSGGTNISVVPLGGATVRETARIRTSNVRLYAFDYDVKTDSVKGLSEHDYSDRPQFLGQLASGQVMYSTKPTAAAADGTIRIFDAARDTTTDYNRGTEVLTQYAIDGSSEGKGVVVNALEVDRSEGVLIVWPRRLQAGSGDPAPIVGTATVVRDSLARLRTARVTDTRIDLYVNIVDVGISDTTFVATSADHGAIAFGEGAANPGRVFYYQNRNGGLAGATVNTDDLVGNAAERVVGLSLNGDGSLGIARGAKSYFFDSNLRLQGVVESGEPSGGVALHPLNVGYPNLQTLRVGFVSGVDAEGQPFIDVVDSYSFRQLRRILIREPIRGTLVVAPVAAGDPEAATKAVRLFGITDGGVVEIGLAASDLR